MSKSIRKCIYTYYSKRNIQNLCSNLKDSENNFQPLSLSVNTVMGQDLAITSSASLHQDCYQESHSESIGTQNTDAIPDNLNDLILGLKI